MALLSWLFATDKWVPRGVCGVWPDGLRWAWFAGHLGIFAAYVGLPIALAWFWRRRRNEALERPAVLLSYAAFIASCGIGHLFEVTVFWWPAYRLYAFWGLLTAAASWAALWASIRAFPAVLRLPSRQMYHDALDRAHAEVLAREELILNLEGEVKRLRDMQRTGLWREAASQAIDRIAAITEAGRHVDA